MTNLDENSKLLLLPAKLFTALCKSLKLLFVGGSEENVGRTQSTSS